MDSYYFLGIGGIGMSALAHILLEKNQKVSGTDSYETPLTQELRNKGALITIGKKGVLAPNSFVIYSSAIKEDHPDFIEAKKKQLPLLHRSVFLHKLMQEKTTLLVTGTHGKTSTSGLLTYVCHRGGLSPTFAVGGIILNFNKNGGNGEGKYFVAEADESDGSFLNYPGDGAIITNIEADHLDYWKTEQSMKRGFLQFIEGIKDHSLFFWGADDPYLSSLEIPGVSYGFSDRAILSIYNFRQEESGLFFSARFEGKTYEEIFLPLTGRHQALNALAVFGMALRLGINEHTIREAFATFKGMKRRLEVKKEGNGIIIYDDYGHHPTEIRVTLSSLKEKIGGKRLVVIFQPHRYTRTRDLLDDFASCFDAADLLVVTDIYSAGEAPIAGIHSQMLFEKIQAKEGYYFNKEELIDRVKTLLKPSDVVITMGAGDITNIGEDLI